jgi:hypothetical protein
MKWNQGVTPLFVCVVVAFAGCSSSGPKPTPAFDAQLASNVSATASQAAVAKTGARVCRWVPLGISERDLVRGVVQQAEADALRVRIEDPGRYTNSLNGTQLARGALVLDKAIAWTPCVF